jgi:bacteriocin-like protein
MKEIIMRKLSKEEMQAVSGGDDRCPGGYWSPTSYSCATWPLPPTGPGCQTKKIWVQTGYNQGYWATVCK